MRCKHCNKRLAVAALLKGQFSFCCDEHRELYLKSEAAQALERLRDSFGDLAPKKPLLIKKPARDADPALAEGFAHSRAEGWEEPVAVEGKPVSPTGDAGEATEPADRDATDQDPPESTLIRVRLAPHDLRDESLLTSDAAEPIPAVPLPISPVFQSAGLDPTSYPLDVAPEARARCAGPKPGSMGRCPERLSAGHHLNHSETCARPGCGAAHPIVNNAG